MGIHAWLNRLVDANVCVVVEKKDHACLGIASKAVVATVTFTRSRDEIA